VAGARRQLRESVSGKRRQKDVQHNVGREVSDHGGFEALLLLRGILPLFSKQQGRIKRIFEESSIFLLAHLRM